VATFSTLPIPEAQRLMLPARQAMREQYRQFVGAIPVGGAGRLELEVHDRPITERARLRAAARSLGLELVIQRRGTVLVFWPTGVLG
jgi:hypothetical protein